MEEITLKKTLNENWNIYIDGKIKSMRWLTLEHALEAILIYAKFEGEIEDDMSNVRQGHEAS